MKSVHWLCNLEGQGHEICVITMCNYFGYNFIPLSFSELINMYKCLHLWGLRMTCSLSRSKVKVTSYKITKKFLVNALTWTFFELWSSNLVYIILGRINNFEKVFATICPRSKSQQGHYFSMVLRKCFILTMNTFNQYKIIILNKECSLIV